MTNNISKEIFKNFLVIFDSNDMNQDKYGIVGTALDKIRLLHIDLC
jgi:hypothetical protein